MKFELEETVWNKFSFWNTKSDGEKVGILTPKTGFFREVFLDSWWTLVVQAFNIVETLEKRPSGFLSASGDQNSTLDAWQAF